MPDRKSLVTTLWLTSSLALLACLLVAPIRTSGSVSDSSQPDCLRRDYALTPGDPATRLSAVIATDAVMEVDALASENEEQDRTDALNGPRVSFLIPGSFRKIPDRQLITSRAISSLYHLRC